MKYNTTKEIMNSCFKPESSVFTMANDRITEMKVKDVSIFMDKDNYLIKYSLYGTSTDKKYYENEVFESQESMVKWLTRGY